MQQPAPSRREVANNHIGNNATIHQGDNAVHFHLPPQPARAAIRVIPYPRNEEIVHRPDLVEKLNTLLPQTSTSAYCSAALWGLGGSGKTQIALDYAYQRCDNTNCSVFWVHADNEATFSQDYKTIAHKFGIDESLKSEDLFAAVRDQITTRPDWVLILDNADELKLFGVGHAPDQPKSLLKYIPHAPTGTVLWTSRDAHIVGTLVGPRRGIEVASMRPHEAEELLMISRSIEMDTVEEEIAILLEELQWLPLAITQAGAYMRRTSTSVKEYLSLLAQSKKRWSILKRNEFDRHRRGDVPNNVLETWSISIDRIGQESEMAYRILHVISYIDNQNIPHEMITAIIRHSNKNFKKLLEMEEETDDNSEADDDLEAEAVKAIMRLKEYSFIGVRQVEDGERNYEIHKLVQEAARYGLSLSDSSTIITNVLNIYTRKESEGYFSSIALQVIKELFPDPQQNTWAQCEKYLAHAVQVAEWADLSEKQNETAKLLDTVSNFLYDRARWREKELVDKRALELRQKVLGERHPDTITNIASLASTYFQQGRYSEAEPLDVQVLSLRQEVLGDKHPNTINAIANLASIYHQQGQYSKAEPLQVQVLSLQQEVLGDKHPDTISAIANLASTYHQQGQYSKAEPLQVQVLSLQQEVLGDKHPNTILAIANLASTYHQQGRYSEAEHLQVQVLSLQQEVLGDKHPSALRAMHNLAYTWERQGRHHDALVLLQQCLQYRRDTLGPGHPDTVSSSKAVEQWASLKYFDLYRAHGFQYIIRLHSTVAKK
ncbi:hypothetical protein TARUN_7273 [Trichoderma arundinaceum]|uniref:ORC1/DEAH AAA+ ATPase domain-containing protein n=1 Tax=Trichoderma arundinaceum TaxID=490622 RepID=A0A395NGF4_TRIAR|nr:hypothetical protein TARUN_7273 [Trichoderma arundinaceum]